MLTSCAENESSGCKQLHILNAALTDTASKQAISVLGQGCTECARSRVVIRMLLSAAAGSLCSVQ